MSKKRRGEIEEWLRRVFFGGPREDYVVFVKHRTNGELVYRAIPANSIDDVRSGYIVVGSEKIPIHRVAFIKRRNGTTVYSRSSSAV